MPSEECIDILVKNSSKIDVRYSVFECVREEHRKQLIDTLKKNGVNAETYHFIFGNDKWYDSGDYMEFNNDEVDVYRMYKKCAARHCWTLADDYLVNCSKILSLMMLRGRGDFEANNIVDITAAREKRYDIEELLENYNQRYRNVAPIMCGYCKGTENLIEPGIQITREELDILKKQLIGK